MQTIKTMTQKNIITGYKAIGILSFEIKKFVYSAEHDRDKLFDALREVSCILWSLGDDQIKSAIDDMASEITTFDVSEENHNSEMMVYLERALTNILETFTTFVS